MSLTPQSLADAMENSSGVDYAALFPAVNQCLLKCGCTTVDRAAMWFGQVGEESGGLRWMEELASGAEYEGRADLGNWRAGDGARFKGRGPIQVTGRHNYTALSQWAFGKGLVPSATFFVDNPEQLASNQYGFIGVTWYWTTQRPMNDAADARDIVRATKYVNGGTHGLDDRTQRWNHALGMGDAILPSGNAPTPVAAPTFHEDNQIGRYNNFSSRHGRAVDLLIIHTEEPNIGQPQNGGAQRLADVIKASENSSNPVSYQYSVGQNRDGTVDVIDIVDTDYEAWAVLDSNPDSINYCFAESSVSWTTEQWMAWYGNAIDVVAYLIVQDARKYDVLIKVIPPPYNSDPPGITDHAYVTDHLHDGSHTDVGPNFPWPYFADRINHYANGAEDDMPLINGPSRSIYRDDDNPIGDGTEVEYQNNGMIHESLIERLAGLGEQASVDKVTAVAQGRAPVQLPDWTRARAQAVLDAMPKAEKGA
jgi:predicted chitinase